MATRERNAGGNPAIDSSMGENKYNYFLPKIGTGLMGHLGPIQTSMQTDEYERGLLGVVVVTRYPG